MGVRRLFTREVGGGRFQRKASDAVGADKVGRPVVRGEIQSPVVSDQWPVKTGGVVKEEDWMLGFAQVSVSSSGMKSRQS